MIPGRTYQKGTRKRTVIGIEGFYVIYQTHAKKPKVIGEAIYRAKRWFDKSQEV